MKALELQKEFNRFYELTPSVTTVARLRNLKKKFDRMNNARVREGMKALSLPNLEAKFERFL